MVTHLFYGLANMVIWRFLNSLYRMKLMYMRHDWLVPICDSSWPQFLFNFYCAKPRSVNCTNLIRVTCFSGIVPTYKLIMQPIRIYYNPSLLQKQILWLVNFLTSPMAVNLMHGGIHKPRGQLEGRGLIKWP